MGGVAVGYPDGTSSLWHVNDQNGTSLNQASAGSTWLNRCADISMGGAEQVAPSSLSVVVDSTTGAGAWSIYYGDMSITSTNGTVTQINLGSASQLAVQGAGISGTPTANWETVSETNDPTSAQIAATHYLATDHLGSSQMEFSQGGWPVASKQFAPYGGELNAQTTLDHYKFTGKERDSESGLDYFGARYFGSETGRFMSPDWAAKAEPVPYAKLADPQTLNLYAYAGNNPLSQIDTDGHDYFHLCSGAEQGAGTCSGGSFSIQSGSPPPQQQQPAQKQNNTTGYSTQDQAAKAVLTWLNPQSIKEYKEYAGLIYKDANGLFHYNTPNPGTDTSSPVGTIPAGTTEYGDYHTHGDYSAPGPTPGTTVRTDKAHDRYNSDHFSTDDKQQNRDSARSNPAFRGYLGTPSGALLIYNPITNKEGPLQ